MTRKLRRTKEIVRTEQLIQLIAEQDGLREEFDEQLFKMTAEKIVVSKEHDITFCLHNGLKLTEREADRMQWHMPIGYKVVDGKITICEEQRKIVEQIFTDYDSGSGGRQDRPEPEREKHMQCKRESVLDPCIHWQDTGKPKLPWHRILSAAHRRGTV